MRRARGFTLVELLVALFALALLAMLSWRGLDGMARAQERTAERADEVLALQIGLAQWTADLEALVQIPQLTALEWNGRALRMTRRGTASVTDGLRVVAWTRRDGQWFRWQSPPLVTRGEVAAAWLRADQWSQNPGDAERRDEVMVTPLEEWQLFYFRADAWTNPLSSDATAGVGEATGSTTGGRATGIIPDGVRLVLQLPPGRAITGRITRDWVRPTVGGGKS
ncbi:prepilin-type N-terminal cleavage/methylation domain-containing protein [Caenimonas sedimenti]|uniref:Prepilin-type N-terminal cleavage/methylation domain-containing protein n=1 Tax=Caenimonas sedimenti TaxID=2596921 RepID=A0A562ZF99_9BURK|nr:prepilin-type N-terminal cleavage/methylation domain-containing protein [Caenimonas sedimenti]TWO65531.1 prepilin-type N-terminal cleavage/methylation domain-containing protein [Caenimonas sedimenti]